MAAIPVTNLTTAGAAPTFAAAAAGDTLKNDGHTFLHVKNGSGSPINVTLTATLKCSHGATHDLVVAVAAGGEQIIGPLSLNRFPKNVAVGYSSTTTVTRAAFKA